MLSSRLPEEMVAAESEQFLVTMLWGCPTLEQQAELILDQFKGYVSRPTPHAPRLPHACPTPAS